MTHGSDTIIPADWPALKLLVWSRDPRRPLSGEEAFALYERNWRFVDPASLTPAETALIADLTRRYGNGHFLAG